MTEKTALARFGERQLAAFKALSELTTQKKRLEEQEAEIKAAIVEAMDHYGVKSFKNDYITLTRVPESVSETVDLKALQNAEPELYEELLGDYKKVTKRAEYVRMTVKTVTEG